MLKRRLCDGKTVAATFYNELKFSFGLVLLTPYKQIMLPCYLLQALYHPLFFLFSINFSSPCQHNNETERKIRWKKKMLLFKRRVLTQSSTLAFWQIVSSRAKTNEKKHYLILLKNTKNPGSPFSSILFLTLVLLHQHRTGIWLIRCLGMTHSALRCFNRGVANLLIS